MRTPKSVPLWIVALGTGPLAMAGFFLLDSPSGRSVLTAAMALLATVAIVVGLWHNRPGDSLAWWALLGATALLLGYDLVNVACFARTGHGTPFPAWTDLLDLAAYPLLFLGILRLARNPDRKVRREDYADAGIVTIACAAVAWFFLMTLSGHPTQLGTAGQLESGVFPIMDVLLIFIVLRSLVFNIRRLPYESLLLAALIALLVGDFAFEAYVLRNLAVSQILGNVGSLVAFSLLAATALHPSIGPSWQKRDEKVARDDHPSRGTGDDELRSRRRIPAIMGVGFIPPVLLVATDLGPDGQDILPLALMSLAVFVLFYLRFAWLLKRVIRQSEEALSDLIDLQRGSSVRDVLEDTLRYQAFHDELTGLPNRALLTNRISQSLAASARSGQMVALCLGDMDGFKLLNDTRGHEAGDAALVKVGEILRSVVRPSDTIARLGGDEFALFMADVVDPCDTIDVAQRIVTAVKQAADNDPNMIGISMSLGVAFADSRIGIDQLFAEADAAMYGAKRSGRNRVEVFRPDMRANLVVRSELTSTFYGSLERSEFFLEYLPIVNLRERRLTGFEALVRWQHPKLGLVGPSTFIPVAEETGFIVPLGRWVMANAVSQLAAWNDLTDVPLQLAVNLSRRQLNAPGLVSDVRTALAFSSIDPAQLILEVSEGALMEHMEVAASSLRTLRDLKVKVAVDDFGTGYSALSYLQKSQVDIIKIDKSFIDILIDDARRGAALVGTMIGLGHSLDLALIAEGIEDERQVEKLIELGCEEGQGYFIDRPLRAHEVATLLKTGDRSASAMIGVGIRART